jgi:hypothetical protein
MRIVYSGWQLLVPVLSTLNECYGTMLTDHREGSEDCVEIQNRVASNRLTITNISKGKPNGDRRIRRRQLKFKH